MSSRRGSFSQQQPIPPFFSPLFGEIPCIIKTPQEPVDTNTHLILPCYNIPSNISHQLWLSIFPIFQNISTVSELTRLYSITSPTTLALLQSLPQQESAQFLRDTMPIIASLAAIHPSIFPNSICLPLQPNSKIALNRIQVASLFALAFLGIFRLPNKYLDAKQFPKCLSNADKVSATKLRCYMAYFSTIGISIINKDPSLQELVTFQRIYSECQQWSLNQNYVTTDVQLIDGLIEKEDQNVLKSVFSSKNIGGNILEDGCSQEEIVFLKCPECMVGLLLSPVLNATESFRITNIIQYSEVLGYATEINFQGNIASKKIKHCFVFFDALICVDKKLQYSQYGIERELNKVYSAMSKCDESDYNLPFATGKWGCGYMLGDARLKFIIQLLASSLSGRQMRYHPLNDFSHKDEIITFMNYITMKKPTIQQLYNYILFVASSDPSKLLTHIEQL